MEYFFFAVSHNRDEVFFVTALRRLSHLMVEKSSQKNKQIIPKLLFLY